MNNTQLDILGISETFWKGVGNFTASIPIVAENYRVIFSGGDVSRRGVALILTERAQKALMYCNTTRTMLIKIQDRLHNTIIIQVYAPTTDSDDTAEDFYEDITASICANAKSRDKIIISDDVNAKVGRDKVGNVVGPFGLGVRNDRGDNLIEFAQRHKLFVANTWFEKRERARHTWTAPNSTVKNQVNYILVSTRYRNSVRNAKTRQNADCGSDHNPIVIITNTRLKQIQR
ncbi:craniofacial development protein 2-like [Penaeus chinensis]|uniref:craniofacial development protein 2-like n=1 Tax=Penaeus chinensis TaxID=139456 RepID=UPI001FB657AA|nr:craniofacial development protein 2-like [Penaeus chinensis]